MLSQVSEARPGAPVGEDPSPGMQKGQDAGYRLGLPAEEKLQLGPMPEDHDRVEQDEDGCYRPVPMVEQKVICHYVGNVRTQQHQCQHYGAVGQQKRSSRNLDSFDEIDITACRQNLHEGMKGRDGDKYVESVESKHEEDHAQKQPCPLNDLDHGELLRAF